MDQHSNPSPSFINVAALFLFAVVIAVTSSVTTYFFLNSRSNQQYSSNETSVTPPQTYVQPTSVPVGTTTQTVPDETAGWKVYRNNVFGFRFKYPATFTLSDKLPKSRQSELVFGDQDIRLKDNTNNMTMTLIAASKGTCCAFGTPSIATSYKVSNTPNKGVIVLKEEKVRDSCAFDPSEELPPILDCIGINPPLTVFNNEYFMWFEYNKGYANGPITFKQILSTFKFLE